MILPAESLGENDLSVLGDRDRQALNMRRAAVLPQKVAKLIELLGKAVSRRQRAKNAQKTHHRHGQPGEIAHLGQDTQPVRPLFQPAREPQLAVDCVSGGMHPRIPLSVALLLGAFCLQTPHAAAQDAPRFEVYGGFAYQNTNHDFAEQRTGWVASQTAYIKPWIGVEVELAGLYGGYDLIASDITPQRGLKSNQQSYYVGPRFRLWSNGRVSLGAHALFGASERETEFVVRYDPNSPIPIRSQIDRTSFGAVAGVSMDVRLAKNLSWRLQPDWEYREAGGPTSALRVTTGVVVSFGR